MRAAFVACVMAAPLGAAQGAGAELASARAAGLGFLEAQGEAPERPTAVLRSRVVSPRLALLEDDAFEVELDAATTILAVKDRAASARSGAWVGDVAGSPHGSVRLVRRGDAVVGTIRAEGRLYRVRPDRAGRHVLELVDETQLPACTGHAHAPEVTAGDGSGSNGGGGGGGSLLTGAPADVEIDVLVVYTPTARIVAGGTNAMRAMIDLAVLETNEAFENSGIDARVRLAHAAEMTGYAETSSFNTELDRLRNPLDGQLDDAHALRDLYGADQVTMIVNNESSCGLAYVQSTPGPWFDQLAFSVVSRNCATGYYSFGHELAHNLGCQHDRPNAGSAAYDYSYGHRASNGTWRTIMSYAPGQRVQHFSSPAVTYGGEPTGVAPGQPNSADNAETIRSLAAAMADFRDRPVGTYGEGRVNSLGRTPRITWSGTTSAAAGDFRLKLVNGVPGQGGVVHYGSAAEDAPFMGGTLLASLPLARLASFRIRPDGTVSVPVPVVSSEVGTTRYYQFLFRDPAQPSGPGVSMSNGLRARFLP